MRYGTASRFLTEAYFNGFQSLAWQGSISRTIHVHAYMRNPFFTRTWYVRDMEPLRIISLGQAFKGFSDDLIAVPFLFSILNLGDTFDPFPGGSSGSIIGSGLDTHHKSYPITDSQSIVKDHEISYNDMSNSRNILYSVGSSLKYRNMEKSLDSGNATMIMQQSPIHR